jgi:hypothetical protein
MQPAALLAVARVCDQTLDLQDLRDQLATQALKARSIDDTLRFGSNAARVFDDCSGPGQQGISISGHL